MRASKVTDMKIATLAVLAASFFALAIPGAEASMHHSSRHMMMRSHHMHMMHRSGRMPASRNF